jgi:DNA-binding MarR family transcriptional regulator
VRLTPKARRLRDRLLSVSESVNENGATGIAAHELAVFRKTIRRLTSNLDRIDR